MPAASIGLNEIRARILTGNFSREDLQAINDAVGMAWRKSQNAVKAQFKFGDRVQFLNSRNGLTVEGQIVKINPKNIVVMEAGPIPRRWNVSPGLLKKA